jgi:alkylation response protein AidB-like acyl-CoA dehydrogenase
MADIVPISPEQADLRRAVRQIADKYGHRYFVECATSHKEPTELYGELGAGGFLGVHLPEEYGGGGAGLGELTAVIKEVSAAGCPLLMMVIAPAICGSIIAAHGSPEVKRAWLPGPADGTRTMSFAITEPEAGSNTHALATTARRSRDAYVISGTKYWISGADQADAILVVTRDADKNAGEDAGATPGQDAGATPGRRTPLSMFVVPAGAPGMTMHAIGAELVQPEKQFTVFFDDVRLPAGALVGEAGQGFRAVFAGLNPERVTAAAISNGISRYALERATQYARDQPRVLRPRGSELPALLQVARRARPARAPVPVLLDGQVPPEPGVAAVVPQHRFLGGRGDQPVPGHTNTLSNTTDNSGEVKRHFRPGPKAGVPTPRSS